MKQRKCPDCGTWNEGNDLCKNCGEPLSSELLHKEYLEKLEKEEQEKEDPKFVIFLNKMKHHKWIPVRILYYVLYVIYSIYMAIVGFVVFIAATTQG